MSLSLPFPPALSSFPPPPSSLTYTTKRHPTDSPRTSFRNRLELNNPRLIDWFRCTDYPSVHTIIRHQRHFSIQSIQAPARKCPRNLLFKPHSDKSYMVLLEFWRWLNNYILYAFKKKSNFPSLIIFKESWG